MGQFRARKVSKYPLLLSFGFFRLDSISRPKKVSRSKLHKAAGGGREGGLRQKKKLSECTLLPTEREKGR